MSTPANTAPALSDAEQDFDRAASLAQKAVEAEDRNAAKFFHGLARFYWARCNNVT